MAWTDPLTATSTYHRPSRTGIFTVRDAARAIVATAVGKADHDEHVGAMGAITIRTGGTPQQNTRAAILIFREAFALADALGLTIARVEIAPSMGRLFYRAFGEGIDAAEAQLIERPAHELRTALLNRTAADGSLTRADQPL